VDNNAGIITLEYTADGPEMAAAAANAYVQLINEFNVGQRRSRAAALRDFLETDALPRASTELSGAEDSLADFYRRNKSFDASPNLRLDEARLQRRIAVKQQAYLELARQVEQARVDEIRNTPVITIVSGASPPTEPSSPKLVVNVLLGVILGVGIWLMLVLFAQYAAAVWQEDPGGARALALELGRVAKLRRRGHS
jgi:uncharacterized protein involved in exopolysaccharide biosynthesis